MKMILGDDPAPTRTFTINLARRQADLSNKRVHATGMLSAGDYY